MSYASNQDSLFPDLDNNISLADPAMAAAIRAAANKYTNEVHPETYTPLPSSTASTASTASTSSPTTQVDPTLPPPVQSPSIFSYFTKDNAISEFKADIGELVLVFITSSTISYFMGDTWLIAAERGSMMSIGQYIGGFISDAAMPMMSSNAGLITKFVIASGVYIGGNEYILTNATPLEYKQMLGESVIAAIIAHYAGASTRTQLDNLSQNKFLSMYN